MEVAVRSDHERWPQTDRVLRQFVFMDLVMERAGVDPVLAARQSGGAALADARNICLNCSFQSQCRCWLERGGGLSGPSAFCPNAGFFTECRRARRQA